MKTTSWEPPIEAMVDEHRAAIAMDLFYASRWPELMALWNEPTGTTLGITADIAYCQVAEAMHMHDPAKRVAAALLVARPTDPNVILNYKVVFRWQRLSLEQLFLIRDHPAYEIVKALEAFDIEGNPELARTHFHNVDAMHLFLWPRVMDVFTYAFWSRTETDKLTDIARAYLASYPQFACAALFYANILEMQNKYREAEDATMRSLELQPTMEGLQLFAYQQFNSAQNRRGKIASPEQALHLALDAAERMQAFCHINSSQRMLIADIYLDSGDKQSARKMLDGVSVEQWNKQTWQKSGAVPYARIDLATDPSREAAVRVIERYLPAMLAGAGHRPETYEVAAEALKRLGKTQAEGEFRSIANDLSGGRKLAVRTAIQTASDITLKVMR